MRYCVSKISNTSTDKEIHCFYYPVYYFPNLGFQLKQKAGTPIEYPGNIFMGIYAIPKGKPDLGQPLHK